jgi:hypothetical protein
MITIKLPDQYQIGVIPWRNGRLDQSARIDNARAERIAVQKRQEQFQTLSLSG